MVSFLLSIVAKNFCVLCIVIAPVERRNREKTSSFEERKDPLPSRQCAGAHLRNANGRWSPVTFFISKLEKMARRITVHVERGGHRPSRCLF